MSYLNIQNDMYLIYEFKKDKIRYNEYKIDLIHKLSLDESKTMGIKYNHGLFASDEWWRNIDNGTIPTIVTSGEIIEIFEAGMDHTGIPNSFRFIDDSGKIMESSMYFLRKKDKKLFLPQKRIMIFYAFDELKNPDYLYSGDSILENDNYVSSVIEMAISI
ncbi:hypothetical protein [Kingella oralis]|jgi:hypothetical protein|uniref:hypothetical protein n=2 Tax=Kingella oralis TaxID=505 RepID=UPI0034E6189D